MGFLWVYSCSQGTTNKQLNQRSINKMIQNKKFKDIRTGEIVEQFNIMDIKYMEEVKNEQ